MDQETHHSTVLDKVPNIPVDVGMLQLHYHRQASVRGVNIICNVFVTTQNEINKMDQAFMCNYVIVYWSLFLLSLIHIKMCIRDQVL